MIMKLIDDLKLKIQTKINNIKTWFKVNKKEIIIWSIIVFMFCIGFTLQYKFTYYFAFIVGFLWFACVKFQVRKPYHHEDTIINGTIEYHRTWLLYLTMIITFVFLWFLYIFAYYKQLL
jgi:hypothetical protein